jgi:hypothetical protein
MLNFLLMLVPIIFGSVAYGQSSPFQNLLAEYTAAQGTISAADLQGLRTGVTAFVVRPDNLYSNFTLCRPLDQKVGCYLSDISSDNSSDYYDHGVSNNDLKTAEKVLADNLLTFEEQRACFQNTKGWTCFKKATDAPVIFAVEMAKTGEVTRVSKFEHTMITRPITNPLTAGQYSGRINSRVTMNIVVFPPVGETQQIAFSNSHTGVNFVTALTPSECAGLPCFIATGNLQNYLCRYINIYDYRLEIVPVDGVTLYVTRYGPGRISSDCKISSYKHLNLTFTKHTGLGNSAGL